MEKYILFTLINMATININETDANSTIKVSAGDIINISLKENPTTGYMWEISQYDSVQLELLNDRFQATSTAAGGGGTRIYEFKVLVSGEGNITLANKQKWENNISQTFSIRYNAH